MYTKTSETESESPALPVGASVSIRRVMKSVSIRRKWTAGFRFEKKNSKVVAVSEASQWTAENRSLFLRRHPLALPGVQPHPSEATFSEFRLVPFSPTTGSQLRASGHTVRVPVVLRA